MKSEKSGDRADERAGGPRTSSARGRVGSGTALSLLVVSALGAAGVGVFAFSSGREVLATNRLVEHTLDVLRRIESLRASMLEAESRQRDFLLTGDEQALAGLPEVESRVQSESRALRQVTVDNVVQQRNVARIAATAAERLRLLRERVDLARRVGREAAQAEAGTGALVRDRALGLLDEVAAEENRLLAERLEAQGRSVRQATIGIAILSGAAAVMLAGIAGLGRSYFATRAAADRAAAASAAQLRQIADSLPHLIYVTDDRGEVELVNDRWRAFSGLDPERIQRDREAEFVHPEDLASTLDAWRHSLETGEPYTHELRVRRRDGQWVWHLSRALRITDPESGQTHWLGSMTDIDDRRRSEVALRDSSREIERLNGVLDGRVSELAAMNQELESFSYSVSHDLRAPLRHIAGFVDLLERSFPGGLEGKPLHYVQTIRASASDMGKLIDALLDFSRIGRGSIETRRVALAPLIQKAVESVCQLEPGRDIEWKIGALPDVEADAALLTIAFENLLANAVKYSRTRAQATIEVGAEVDDSLRRRGLCSIFVRDNGVGFDMAYVDKLFGVFQRLHAQRDFEGTGIGLATVKRIIARHGGDVRAEGQMGKGATFRVELREARGAAR